MKTFTFLSLVIGIVFSVSSFAQNVPNGDFEEWGTSSGGGVQPNGWIAPANSLAYSNVFQSPGYNSDYCAELKPTDFPGFGVMASVLFTNIFGVSQKYGQLTGYVKGIPVNSDTLTILVVMFKGANEMVGSGAWFITEQNDNFTEFKVDINYFVTEEPDSCRITFMAGKSDGTASEGTTFSLDNISLIGHAGIGDVESAFSTVGNPYPNPANSFVNIPFELKEPSEVTLKVYNMQGRLMYSQTDKNFGPGSNEITIDVGGYGAGAYFITLSTSLNSIKTKSFVVK